MADRKRTKLSLKRKTISNKSSLFNSIGQRQESVSDTNVKDPENVIVNLSSDSETDGDLTDHQNLQPNKRQRFCEVPTGSNSNEYKTRPIQLKPERMPSETSKPSSFLDVDEDLRRLRMMFLKLQNPRINVKKLSDLPDFTETQNGQTPEQDGCDKNSTELSPLPPMCKWCLRRKPSDYSKLYSDIIQQELQPSMADRPVSEHQRALQSSVRGDNSIHSGSICVEKGGRFFNKGSMCAEKGEASMQAKNTNLKTEESSFPKIKLTSVLNNPTCAENNHKGKVADYQKSNICRESKTKIESEKSLFFIKEKGNISGIVKTQSDNVVTQPGNIKTQPGYIKTQPGNIKIQPGNIKTQPGNIKTQPGSIKTQPGNIKTQPGNIKIQPGNIKTQPGNIKTQQGNIKTQPDNIETQPGNIKTQPGNIKTQPGNIKTQPGNIKTQPGNIKTQPDNIKTQPGNIKTQPGNIKTQPGNIKTHSRSESAQPGNINRQEPAGTGMTHKEKHCVPSPYSKVDQSNERENSNKETAVSKGVGTGLMSYGTDRKNTNNSVEQTVKVNRAVAAVHPTERVGNKPKHTNTNENKPVFQGRSSGNLDTEKLDVSKEVSGSSDVQCCPLCQTTFEKGTTQMDIDGHIAICLSMSGDDVTW